jgi:hypothetical protein
MALIDKNKNPLSEDKNVVIPPTGKLNDDSNLEGNNNSVTFGTDISLENSPNYFVLTREFLGNNFYQDKKSYFSLTNLGNGWFRFEPIEKNISYLISGIESKEFSNDLIIDDTDTIAVSTNQLSSKEWKTKFKALQNEKIDDSQIKKHKWHKIKFQAYKDYLELDELEVDYIYKLRKVRFKNRIIAAVIFLLIVTFCFWQRLNIASAINDLLEEARTKTIFRIIIDLVIYLGGSLLIIQFVLKQLSSFFHFVFSDDEKIADILLKKAEAIKIKSSDDFSLLYKRYLDVKNKYHEYYKEFPCTFCNNNLGKNYWLFEQDILKEGKTAVSCPHCNTILMEQIKK